MHGPQSGYAKGPMSESDDPRTFPEPAAATPESARLHGMAAASQAAATGQQAAALDAEIRLTLDSLLAPGQGERLSAVFATTPSVAVHRHLWRLLAQCEREFQSAGNLKVTIFALPVIVVAGIEGTGVSNATLPCVLENATAIADIMREHGALAGNQAFALANALVAAGSIDLTRLPDMLEMGALRETEAFARDLAPAGIVLSGGPETVHLRFVVGSAVAAHGADLTRDTGVGTWGIPVAQALGRGLAVPGVSVLALPRAPQSLLQSVQQGRAAQREVGAQIFATNAIRRLRASVGEPTAVISSHRAPAAIHGGEVRLSLSSPFDPREAEGFRCPLYPLDSVEEVVVMLTNLLGECRVADVRIVPGIHADRDPSTGMSLLFKGDSLSASTSAVH